MRVVKDAEWAEEILHDAFVKIWEKIDLYDASKGKLYTWMINISRNLAIDATRSKRYSQQSKTITDTEYVYHNDSGVEANTYSGIDKLLGKLPEEQLFLITKVFYEGYTHSEVATSFEIPLGTVKTRIRSAVKALGRMLEK